jgi:hypothetical protein
MRFAMIYEMLMASKCNENCPGKQTRQYLVCINMADCSTSFHRKIRYLSAIYIICHTTVAEMRFMSGVLLCSDIERVSLLQVSGTGYIVVQYGGPQRK